MEINTTALERGDNRKLLESIAAKFMVTWQMEKIWKKKSSKRIFPRDYSESSYSISMQMLLFHSLICKLNVTDT